MKLNNLKINGYGKLSNKEIKLTDKINVVYGKNEAGKSTLLSFINSIFFGASKNKNGKDISVYEKYFPWKQEEYSGKISYSLDNGEKYEVFRDFRRKNPEIYNNQKQDISLNYSIDKTKGIDFIGEQIGIDEETFNNTIIVTQSDVKINKSAQSNMVQKISNMISSGDESISFQKTIDKINKMQLDEIGTERTREKPLNVVNSRIEELINMKGKVESYKKFIEENEDEVNYVQNRINDEEIKLELYRALKESDEQRKIKRHEIEVVEKIRDEYFDKIGELDDKIDKDVKEKIKNEKKSSVFPIILICLFLVSAIICFVLKINKWIGISLIGVTLGICVFEIIAKINFNKHKKIRLQELEELENKIEHEIDLLKNNIKACQSEIDNKQGEIKLAENEVNRLVMNEFEDKIDSDFIEEAFELEGRELDNKIAEKNEKINSLKIEKGAKQNQKDLMKEEVNGIARIQEELNRLEEDKKDLISLNNSYNLAKEGLENAYENIRNSVTPEFTLSLKNIISRITNDKYKEVNFIDSEGLIVEMEDGRCVPVERLSQGTIDQMYLGLRLASISTITSEKMPIFLDETFAFFDDERLQNIIEFISKEYNNKQIIIFTCSNREIDILNKLNIDYNYIALEN